jgi:hypothetical protein
VEAVIFIGIQAAGKTTFYRDRFFDTHVRLSLDMLRTRTRLRLLLAACIEAKQPFVVDNTSLTAGERAPVIAQAHTARFRVTGYYFASTFGESLRRNAERTGRARIPVQGIAGAAKRLQVPSRDEGFDALYRVTIVEGGFAVEEWPDPA